MEQTGTPTSSSPIYPSETGERTENLLPELNLNTSSMGGIEFEKVNSYTIRAHGTMNGYSQCISTNGITLPAGTYFIMSYSTYSGSAFKAQARSQNGQTTYATNNSFTLTEETTVYPRIVTMATYTIPTDEVITIMLNSGSTALPLEPNGYKLPVVCGGSTNNIYLSEPIRKISTYADTAPSTGTASRVIKKLVLTGEETINMIAVSQGNLFRVQIPQQRIQAPFYGYGLCSHYIPVPVADRTTGTISGGNSTDVQDRIDIIDDFSSETAFKAFLAQEYANGTPVCVWYVLSTPTTESFTAPTIPTSNGSNTLNVNTTLAPSNVYIKYKG